MLIKPEEINKVLNLADTKQINKGKKYYEQTRVNILSVKLEKDNSFKVNTVVSDTDTYNYFVSILKNKNNISYTCDCKEHKSSGALCSHIIASLFDIYIDFEKYKSFKDNKNIEKLNIENEEDLKKYIPIELSKKDISLSVSKTLHMKEKDRFIVLYKLVLDLFNRANYNTLLGNLSEFVNQNSKIKVFECETKNPILNMLVYKNNDNYLLKLNLQKYEFFIYKRNLFYKNNDEICMCSTDFTLHILPFIIYYNFHKNDEFIVKNKEELLKYIVSSLAGKEYLNLGISGDIKNDFEKYILKTSLYFDMDENQNIEIKIKYEYNENTYDYFEDVKKDLELRNEYEELRVKKELSDLGFKFLKDKIYLEDEDKKYTLLKEGIERLKNKYDIYFSESFKKKKIKKLTSVSFKVNKVYDLIELDTYKTLDIKASDLKKIIDSYKLKKKFFKLKDGTYIDLENEETLKIVEGFKDVIPYSKENKDGILTFDKKSAIYLDYILNKEGKVKTSYDEEFKKYIDSITNFEIHKYKLPKYLNANLRKYQVEGYNYLMTLKEYRLNGILADEMGLGKTLQVITLLESIKENEENNSTSIVVCPSSLYLNWQKEIERFAPNLKCLTIYGNTKKREKLISKIDKYDVIVTSYDILKRDIDKYLDFEFNYIVADEAQYIKNNFTKNAKALKLLKSKNRLALTGTPMENSLSEIWSIFDFIMPGYLFSYSKFKEKFEKPIVTDNNKNKSTLLKKMISPFILRRLKKDVLKDLPKKTETIIYNVMNDEQKKVYDSYLLRANKEIKEELIKNGINKSQMKILSIITRLRQICLHPKLFIENYEGESAKLEQCIELIKDMILSNHKVVLFSGFTSMFSIIEEKLKENSIKFYKLQGDTKSDTRLDLVNKFNKSDDVKVFLISLKAGGVGLNLTGADVVMHFDPWWNLSKEMQATDRTHRIGQDKNVQVFKYITADSIEEKIQKMQNMKKDLADLVLSGENNFLTKLTEKEIIELFEK